MMYRLGASTNIYLQILLGGIVPILNIILDLIKSYWNNDSSKDIPLDVKKCKVDSITIHSFRDWMTYYNESYIYVSKYINHVLDNNEYTSNHNDILVTKCYGIDDKIYRELSTNTWLTLKFKDKPIYIYNYTTTDGTTDKENSTAMQSVTSKSYYIKIYGESQDLISGFINHCKQFCDNLEKKDKAVYSYEYIINDKTGHWIRSKINVNKTLDTLFLPKQLHYNLEIWVKNFMNKSPEYMEKKTVDKMGICLYGIPGCGKSTIPYAIANQFKMPIREITQDIFNDHADNLQSIFSKITNSIILIEEIDTLEYFNKRDIYEDSNLFESTSFDIIDKVIEKSKKESHTNDDSQKSDKDKNIDKDDMSDLCFKKKEKDRKKTILGNMLKILDGYKYLSGCIIIMTTNDIDAIDPAFIRPGRIDHKINLTYADDYQIHEIFKYYYDGYEVDQTVIDKMIANKLTTSYIINTLVLANLGHVSKAIADYM